MSTISTSNIKRWRKGKQILFRLLQQLSNDNWHFYSTKTSLRASSQWFEVSKLVATSSYHNNTTIALLQVQYRFLKTKISENKICSTKVNTEKC